MISLDLALGTPLVLVANGIAVPAPPAYYVPDANGIALPSGVQSFDIALDDSAFPTNEEIAFGVEIHFANAALNVPLGWYPLIGGVCQAGTSYDKRLGQIVRTIHMGGDIQSRGPDGSFYHPYPDAVRLRVDSIAARLTTVTLTVN
jgi:hypothetical protein